MLLELIIIDLMPRCVLKYLSNSSNVQIPNVYTIQNQDDIIIKEQVREDEKDLIYNFVSSYSIEGQVLKIEIEEYYDELYYPTEKFEPFRKVINAAADWNKIILVLQK